MTPQELSTILDQIEKDRGQLTPEGVVETAKDPDHPLHEKFEWDNSLAGHRYRLMQARAIIRIKQEIRVNHSVIRVVSYLRDPNVKAREQGYRKIEQLKNDIKDALEAFNAEANRVEYAVRRLRDVAAGLGHGDLVDPFLEEIAGLRDKFGKAIKRRARKTTTKTRRKAA